LRARLTSEFARRTRDDWSETFAGLDACVTPVVELAEVASELHLRSRATFGTQGGVLQPSPAPRFSRTPSSEPVFPAPPIMDAMTVLADWSQPAGKT
jgi:alpha-methylacyl-CoA racemase